MYLKKGPKQYNMKHKTKISKVLRSSGLMKEISTNAVGTRKLNG